MKDPESRPVGVDTVDFALQTRVRRNRMPAVF